MAVRAKNDEKIILKIANTSIEIGKVYEISHKYDGSAPDGMRELGATKFPLKGVAEKRAIFFDENRNTFDTGFYPESLCNKGMPAKDMEYVNAYVKHIKTPYEKQFNQDCSETNFDFWDKYKYEVAVNKSFDTKDPKQRFELFHALKQGAVCNVGEKDPVLQKAKYTIKNIEEVKNQEDERLDKKFKAMSTFNILMDSDKEKAYTILEYLGQTQNPRGTDPEALKRTYLRLMDDNKKGAEFVRRFLEASEKYNTQRGKLEMEYFSIAQKLYLKNKIEKKAGAFYHPDGSYLGNTLKDIALKCLIDTDKEYKESIEKLYQALLEQK